jgi:uncharacterized protein
MRSGSGTSRTTTTTTTSDSGEFESQPTLSRTRHVPASLSSISPPQNATPLPPHPQSPPYPSASSLGSNSILSAPSPTPQPHASLAPAASHAPRLSPTASRMRERDAEAMEAYKLRQRSGSAATTSTDAPSLNGSTVPLTVKSSEDDITSIQSLVTVGSVAPRRLLRPSASAAQLRGPPQPLVSAGPSAPSRQPDTRNRSGTDPEVLHQHSPSSSMSSAAKVESSLASPATPTATRPPLLKASSSRDSSNDKDYTGPSSEFAKFPPPPATEPAERSHTPLSRRLPFNLLSSHKHSNGDQHHHLFAHKRNSSANSVVSRIT